MSAESAEVGEASDTQPANSNGAGQPVAPTSSSNKKTNWWLLEIGCVFFSALSIVGMSILLWRYENKPAPIWSFAYHGSITSLTGISKRVTFNAILELFSTASRIALALPLTKALGQLTWVWFTKHSRQLADFAVFDQAAKQNPMGSAKLIWRLKGRHFAVIGALLVLFLQIFGFFVQELVSTQVRYWPDYGQQPPPQIQPNSIDVQKFEQQILDPNWDGELPSGLQIARIANATNYNYHSVGETPDYTVDLFMKSNIWAGLYAADANRGWSIPSYFCSTENCTWSGYSSLGVCSRCANLAPKITKSCTPMPRLNLNNVTGCDVVLPNGFGLGGPQQSRTNLMAVSTAYQPLVYGNYSDPLAIIQSIGAYDTLFVNSSTPIKASECVLFPCVLNYKVSLTWDVPEISKSGFNGVPYFELVDSINDAYTFNTSASPWNGPTINTRSDGTRNDPTVYRMSQPAYLTLKSYLTSLFNGFVTSDGKNLLYSSDNQTRPVSASAEDAMQAMYATQNCIDVFGNSIWDPVMCSITNAAVAMTKSIRDESFDFQNFSIYSATGVTFFPKPTVIVAWLWIVPVIAIWLLSAILLVGTIWKTRRASIMGIGLNPLALIFLGLEGDKMQEAVKEWWNSGKLVKKAEQTNARLMFTDGKASLV